MTQIAELVKSVSSERLERLFEQSCPFGAWTTNDLKPSISFCDATVLHTMTKFFIKLLRRRKRIKTTSFDVAFIIKANARGTWSNGNGEKGSEIVVDPSNLGGSKN